MLFGFGVRLGGKFCSFHCPYVSYNKALFSYLYLQNTFTYRHALIYCLVLITLDRLVLLAAKTLLHGCAVV